MRTVQVVVALAVMASSPSCRVASGLVPGHVVDKDGLQEAQVVVWRASYGRLDPSPLVYVVEGDALTCTSPVTGKPGFECPTVGCREGCTALPGIVSVAWSGAPWSETSLAHEDMHAKKLREALAALRYTPGAALMQALADHDHRGPEWEPGGEVDRANVALREHGL